MGGDITEDHRLSSVNRLIEETGLGARSSEEDEPADYVDERLQSGLGGAVLEAFLSKQLESSAAREGLDEHS